MAKIVVVDNEPQICRFIRDVLENGGHDVRLAGTGDAAIDHGYLFEPDLLIADWNLECDYDGLEVADALNFALDDIKTIVISGSIDKVKAAMKKPVFGMLEKPFTGAELVEMVDQALNS